MVAEQNRELSRSLEAKLSLSHDAPDLQAMIHRSKRKVADLTEQLHEAQTRLLMAEEVGRQQAAEVAVLKRALGLRAELPEGAVGVHDGQAQLLQALTKSQDESASLAAQLADSCRKVASLEHQVTRLHSDMDRLVGARVAAEEVLQSARKEAADGQNRAAALQREVEDLKSQLRRTAAHLQEVQSARNNAETALDSLASKNRLLKGKLGVADREARSQLEGLRTELRSLAQAAESEVQQLHAAHNAREGEWEAQMTVLQKQLAEMEARLSQSDRDHEVEVLRLQSRTGALEAALEGSRLRESSLEREAEVLQGEVARLGRVNAELAATLSASRNEAEAVSERAEEAFNMTDVERRLRMQVHVQSQLEAATTRAAVREEQLAADASALRTEVATLALANERLRGELKVACQEKLSDATARHTINERHIEELHITIQSLTKSKTKLQNTMLEQLSLFKTKLHQVEQENLALRTALATTSSLSSVPPSSRSGPSSAPADPRVDSSRHTTGPTSHATPATRGHHGDAATMAPGGGGPAAASSSNSSYDLTSSNFPSLTSAVRAPGGDSDIGGGGPSVGSKTPTAISSPSMSLRDSALGPGVGGGAAAGGSTAVRGSGGGGGSSRSRTRSLGLDDNRSSEGLLGHYDT
ncbi:hypothetical protein VOLCADRAFT_106111 [Volvox carteri f. nagariensis]|uniref:Uncharacterized protein n=1 Tax=Volvox carteri f. nagariensis TaxID=3068 RepID=D8U558_VOLCA|nr:uncharacterized protein VOLCADRAFT_106111 [Volvox carteri f. nagariensis]EFJ45090.1 hypothetical protein VOLCADRAFT_106111 [Volvox carteri f. nagariensis]|eukprot:XP_002953766.1 hypothetical protein VOLCADRAFT_106111 [Volvox carteri f. nagariensis]